MFFFFNDTATTEIYTLSLHDALPISGGEDEGAHPQRHVQRGREAELDGRTVERAVERGEDFPVAVGQQRQDTGEEHLDRKSTRLNSSHANISYAVFCLKKKKNNIDHL